MAITSLSNDRKMQLAALLAKEGFKLPVKDTISPRPQDQLAIAGAPQRRFWIQQQLEPQPGLNVLGFVVQLASPLSAAVINAALQQLYARHQSLRTRFDWLDGQVVELFSEPSDQPPQPMVSLVQFTEPMAAIHFDLNNGPLWQVGYHSAQPDSIDQLHCYFHHAIIDGFSLVTFIKEFEQRCQASAATVHSSEPPLQQADYSYWRRQQCTPQIVDQQQSYWQQRLAGHPLILSLPAAHSRHSTPSTTPENCLITPVAISDDLAASARQFAQQHGVTLYTVLLGCYAIVLSRFAATDDVIIGTSIDNRQAPQSHGIIGCLTDLVPLRCDLANNPSFSQLIARLSPAINEDFAHTQVGFDEIVTWLSPDRKQGSAPIFQVLFGLLTIPSQQTQATITPLPATIARADIAFDVVDLGGALQGHLECRAGYISPKLASNISEAITAVLRHGITQPQRAIEHLPLSLSPRPFMAYDDDHFPAAPISEHGLPLPQDNQGNLTEIILASAQQHQDQIALISADQTLSFASLAAQIQTMAQALTHRGVRQGVTVAIHLSRSIELVIATLAVLKAGGTVVYLEPSQPPARLTAIYRDCSEPMIISLAAPSWLTASQWFSPATLLSNNDPDPSFSSPPLAPSDIGQDHGETVAFLVFTSGSTGRPKGVRIQHSSLINRIRWMLTDYPIAANERCCLKTSPIFVDFLAELLTPLVGAIPLVICDDETAAQPDLLARYIASHQISRLTLVPSLIRALLDGDPQNHQQLKSLKVCISSGEPLTAHLAQRFIQQWPDCQLLNLYGSSEVTADATWFDVTANAQRPLQDPIAIGRPLPGCTIAVVDSNQQPLPWGVPGEIIVAGAGVTLGYHGDIGQQASGYQTRNQTPIFAMGDLGLINDAGQLVYFGRKDRQIKINGIRIEPAEIEAVLESHPAIDAACVVCHANQPATNQPSLSQPAIDQPQRLAAYIVSSSAIDSATLRAYLSQRLPRAFLPNWIIPLAQLPLGPTGKIDRAALPIPDADAAASGNQRQTDDHHASEPSNPGQLFDPLEALIAETWSTIIGRPITSQQADFFAAGGGSLQAIQAVAKLGGLLAKSIPVALLFDHPVLKDFARLLVSEPANQLPPLSPLSSLATANDEQANRIFPPTANQLWLWDHYQGDQQSTAYNLSIAYQLTGPLNIPALDNALCELVNRHRALRTVLQRDNDHLVQIVQPKPATLLQQSLLPDPLNPAAPDYQQILEQKVQQPFAIDHELPFRAHLVPLTANNDAQCDSHLLVLTMHHVASDGWSGRILAKELSHLYRADLLDDSALANVLPPPPLQLTDFACWQQAAQPLIGKNVESLRTTLQMASAARIPGVNKGVPLAGPVQAIDIDLSPALWAQIDDLCQQNGVTRFVFLLTATAILLARFGDCEQPLIGFAQAGRSHPGSENIVGFLANTLLLGVDLRDAPSVEQALVNGRTALIAALRHQDVPLSWLQSTGAGWPADTSSDALRVMVLEEDQLDWGLNLSQITSRLVATSASPQARVDLAVLVTQRHGQPGLTIEVAQARIPAPLANRLANGLQALIGAAVAQPQQAINQLPLTTTSAPSTASIAVALPTPAPAAQRLAQLLAHNSGRYPELIAIEDPQQSLSYQALQQRAEQIGQVLRGHGVNAGDTVALIAPASSYQFSCLMAIWQLGAIALPLSPKLPQDRINWMLADTQASCVISAIAGQFSLPTLTLTELWTTATATAIATFSPTDDTPASATAAIIYTSGTTGKPKGVPVSHSALCRLGAALGQAYDIQPSGRILQVVTVGFDVALSDIAMALAAAATLVAPTPEAVLPGKTLANSLADLAINHLQLTAGTLAATPVHALPALKSIAVGGEVLAHSVAQNWAVICPLFIAYGPSEATVTATLKRYDPTAEQGTIGRPFAGATVLIVDEIGQPVPFGVAGELIIAGSGVFHGYLNRPELSQEKLIHGLPFANPIASLADDNEPPQRYYRTGDRARMNDQGDILFMGRIDRQMKIRGHRIEPGEIESVLHNIAGIEQALVGLAPNSEGPVLTAWLLVRPNSPWNEGDIRHRLRQQLPEYMVPSDYRTIASIPLTSNGKVDWQQLYEMQTEQSSTLAPTSPNPSIFGQLNTDTNDGLQQPLQIGLLALWRELLQGKSVGLDQKFFDVGGHSLLLVKMHERIESELAIELPIAELFAHTTVRLLAQRIASQLAVVSAAPAAPPSITEPTDVNLGPDTSTEDDNIEEFYL